MRCIVWAMVLAALSLAGCASEPPDAASSPNRAARAADAHERIERAIPAGVADRAGWAADLYAAFSSLAVNPSAENVCAVAAVIEQESGFKVDPIVPHLPAIAWQEIERRAARAGIPSIVVRGVLELRSPNGKTYRERLDTAVTEKQLSDIFEDFTGSVPLGRSLFASLNPIRTRGPMQVNVAFAEQFAADHRYPYPVGSSIADEVFTRRGSVYFGTAHLLAYNAPYDRYLYRFADFNAGQYASRNAAFQRALSSASGLPVVPDGALLAHDADAVGAGGTLRAAQSLAARLGLGDSEIRAALERGKNEDFEQTTLYERVFALAEHGVGRRLPRAALPRITLQGPKISRNLTTGWYANRVEGRFKRCLSP